MKIGAYVAAGLAAGVLCAVTAIHASARHRGAGPSSSRVVVQQGPLLAVPRAPAAIAVDGELEDEAWMQAARTGAFTIDGVEARPYSDARFTYREGELDVMLYAADEDIRTTSAKHDDPLDLADSFELVFHTKDGDRVIDVSPGGVVTDGARGVDGAVDLRWESRARIGVDTDGTANDGSDQDEEWVIEMAIPLDALGLEGRAGEEVGVSARRCDDVRGVGRVCAGWGAEPGRTGRLVLAR